jgi:hypothetical protein
MKTHHSNTYYIIRSSVRTTLLVAVVLSAFFIGKALSQNDLAYSCNGKSVMAEANDTVWSMAEANCEGHIGQAVDDIVKQYGIDVSIGEVITFTMERK